MSGFSTGGVVKILANEKALKLLQEGHGGYNADVGKVHIYDSAPEKIIAVIFLGLIWGRITALSQ